MTGEPKDNLRDVVTQTICHVTSPEGWKGILEAGAILPNEDREFSYPQSAKSYAVRKRAVALFDFEQATPQQLQDHWFKCQTFFRRYSPATYVLVIERSRLPGPLITYEEATAEFGHGFGKIPYLEVWSAQPVPRDAITKVIVVCAHRFETLDSSDSRLLDAESLMTALCPESRQQRLSDDLTKLSKAELLSRLDNLKARRKPDR